MENNFKPDLLQGHPGHIGRNLTAISDRKQSMGFKKRDLCMFFRYRNLYFELRGWPPQPPTFNSNSTKITKTAQFQTSIFTW